MAVGLYRPVPSNNHVLAVQDLGSRFSAAKLLTSPRSTEVIPALEEIYNAYGNPVIQISDNRQPFNSKAMDYFTQNINNENEKKSTIPSIIQPSGNTNGAIG